MSYPIELSKIIPTEEEKHKIISIINKYKFHSIDDVGKIAFALSGFGDPSKHTDEQIERKLEGLIDDNQDKYIKYAENHGLASSIMDSRLGGSVYNPNNRFIHVRVDNVKSSSIGNKLTACILGTLLLGAGGLYAGLSDTSDSQEAYAEEEKIIYKNSIDQSEKLIEDEIQLNGTKTIKIKITFNSPDKTKIGADLVHESGNIGEGRTIVVLDTGYNYNHPALASSYLGGYDFVNNDNDPMDDYGHGSFVAGVITADASNKTSIQGVAPGAGIIAGKVLNATGYGDWNNIIRGIYWAVDGPDGKYGTGDDFNADAINISLGAGPFKYTPFCDEVLPEMTKAIKYATDKGVIVVASAGNDGYEGVGLPGCISNSLTVGAVNNNDVIAKFSGRGYAVDIVAPGVFIVSPTFGNSTKSLYSIGSGTSFSAPMVSGTIALIKAVHPEYIPEQVEEALFSTAKDLGNPNKDMVYRWGRLDAWAAVNYNPDMHKHFKINLSEKVAIDDSAKTTTTFNKKLSESLKLSDSLEK